MNPISVGTVWKAIWRPKLKSNREKLAISYRLVVVPKEEKMTRYQRRINHFTTSLASLA